MIDLSNVQPQHNSVEFDHHPVRATKEASRYFVEVASTPPRRGGENRMPVLLSNILLRPSGPERPRSLKALPAPIRLALGLSEPDGPGFLLFASCRDQTGYLIVDQTSYLIYR